MDLNNILSISGYPGLFKLQTQTNRGIIAISILDGKRIMTSTNQQIIMLSEIQVYCIGKEISLAEVFEKILVNENGCTTKIKPKSPAIDLEAYFFDVIENYDKDRVYPSDIKKIIQWYNILVQKEIIKLVKLKTNLELNHKEGKQVSKEIEK